MRTSKQWDPKQQEYVEYQTVSPMDLSEIEKAEAAVLHEDVWTKAGYFPPLVTQLTDVAMKETQYDNTAGMFFTAGSSFPMIATVRAFFSERARILGEKESAQPTIHAITANSDMADRFEYLGEGNDSSLNQLGGEEIDRLRTILEIGKIDRAYVFDQYVCTGKTILYGQRLLNIAGIANSRITLLGGRYYQDSGDRSYVSQEDKEMHIKSQLLFKVASETALEDYTSDVLKRLRDLGYKVAEQSVALST